MKLQSVRRDLWWKAFQWSARLNRPGLAAWLLDRAIEGAGGSAVSDGEPANILVLDKPGMSEDARAAFNGDPRFRLFVLDTVGIKAFKAMVSAFLPPEVDDNNYVNDTPAAVAGRAAYRAFMARTWAALAGRRRIDAVLTGNYAYYAERELQAVLEARGTPFIALHKENLKSEGRGAFFIDIYRNRRGPFVGRRILVYNAIEREVQIAAGIAAAESVTVTGMPRLDRMHAWRRLAATARPAPSRRPRALFFSFTEKTGLPFLPRKDMAGVAGNAEALGDGRDGLAWRGLTRLFHDAAVALARAAPDIDVVIKSKADPRSRGVLPNQAAGSGALPANLSIISGGDPMTLITGSDAVTGFISTALFEALAAGKPVVVPRFAEAADRAMADYLIDMADAVEYADTPEALAGMMAAHARARAAPAAELTAAAAAALVRWSGNADGQAGPRAAEAVWAEIAGSIS
ncbi:MAG: hypothetical protein VCD66_02900 [Alphaproteobacteria bacterium]